ncbi:MAG: hypothetical protein IAI50_07060 [Candidatus Eremiobacteraeota bacterium]|nr:hypothetical protein [Candidatus Eremiobacteraeota bacterium]
MSQSRAIPSSAIHRAGFVGAFLRAAEFPPYGAFSTQSAEIAPQPYPTAQIDPIGPSAYCNEVMANGWSIDSSYQVDPTKLSNLTNLGVGWTRMTVSQFFDDLSHIFGSGHYDFTGLDAAQCQSFTTGNIKPVLGLEAGPVQYNADPPNFTPVSLPLYKTAADFGQWCGAVAAHEQQAFPSVTNYSLPGNEVNSNPQLFPGGQSQIASYSQACYAAIKAANPAAFVYGFELNMDGSLDAPRFVHQMAQLGCKVGTCYDALAIHLTLRYPIPPPATPCYPHPGGDYSLRCVNDIQTAASAPIHILISETVYPVPGFVPDEATKAKAVVAAFTAFAANPTIDGVSYANVDECALYPSGYFFDGCLVDVSGNRLPAYNSLRQLAKARFL